MVQPTIVATLDSGTFSSSTTLTTGTITSWTPQVNDLVLLCVTLQQSGTAPTISPPAGWANALGGQNVITGNASPFNNMLILAHQVTSAEATAGTTAWTLSGVLGTAKAGRRVVLVARNSNATTPIGAYSGNQGASSPPVSVPAITPTYSNSLIIGFVGGNSQASAESITAPAAPWFNAINVGVSMTWLCAAVQCSTPTSAGVVFPGVDLGISRNDNWVACALEVAAPGNPDKFFALF